MAQYHHSIVSPFYSYNRRRLSSIRQSGKRVSHKLYLEYKRDLFLCKINWFISCHGGPSSAYHIGSARNFNKYHSEICQIGLPLTKSATLFATLNLLASFRPPSRATTSTAVDFRSAFANDANMIAWVTP